LIPANNTEPRRKSVRQILTALDSFARARWVLRSTKQGERVRCYGRVLVEGGPAIEVASRVVFLKGMFPTELRCAEGAELSIGSQTLFNYGVFVSAQRSVRIGARCMFGSLVHIRDDDGRRTSPIVIGDDVWVAHGALIEPGSTVGDGSVVSAGAVVSGNVPPRTLAIGNPARIFPLEDRNEAFALDGKPSSRSPVALAPPAAAVPSRDEVRSTIIAWLDDTRHFGEAANLITSDAMSLREGGLLDSLGLVDLVLMLEQRFAVQIDRELASRPGSQTLTHFIDLVTKPSGSAETSR
jgi:acetyltransferase-like isoleucine patch superfamily enzyme/acyl carrier protein